MGGGLQLHLRGRDSQQEEATESVGDGDPYWTRCEQHRQLCYHFNYLMFVHGRLYYCSLYCICRHLQ